MKALLTLSLLVTTSAFAQQALDVKGLKTLLTQRQAVLERVNAGMSKRLTTITRYPTELGPCDMTETSVQTVLKIEGTKLIVHSKEKYVPAPTPACAGFETQEVGVLFYEDKPSLALDLADLDETAAQIKTIQKIGDIIHMNMNAVVQNDDGTSATEAVTVKYDLTKPSFKNTIFIQSPMSIMNAEDIADIDVYSIDLKNVLFCDSADSDRCSQGDYSDILF